MLALSRGLLSCGVISNVTVRGVSAKNSNCLQIATSCVHCNNLNQKHVLTLENLSGFESVSAFSKAFIIEEPQVFAAVCQQLGEINRTIICPVSGFPAAFMYLLKLLSAADVSLYYAGNMDYKGMERADRLYLEFGKTFILWHYSREDYAHVLSQGSTQIPDEKKNLTMHNETHASLLSHMRKEGKIASFMPLVPLLVEDIRSLVSELKQAFNRGYFSHRKAQRPQR